MSIFGTTFDVSKDCWIAFNEDTLTALSEHETEAEALEACRRYLEREIRRTNILHYLSTHAPKEHLAI
jgi:ribosomal protein L16/L10AE